MASRVALVTGGSGTVGSGIVRSFLKRGNKVVAPCRSERSASTLRESLEGVEAHNLIVKIADVADEEGSQGLARAIKEEYGNIDHVVSCIGPMMWPGRSLVRRLFYAAPCIVQHAVLHSQLHRNTQRCLNMRQCDEMQPISSSFAAFAWYNDTRMHVGHQHHACATVLQHQVGGHLDAVMPC